MRSVRGISTRPREPEPSEWLRLLTGNRLQSGYRALGRSSDGQPLHFEPTTIPGLVGDYPQIPPSVTKFFRKLFRRTDTPATR